MKKPIVIGVSIIGVIIIVFSLSYSIISYNVKANTKAIISEDYSTITYNEKIYKSFPVDNITDFPKFGLKSINATVKNRLFLWDCILTDYIFVSEDGEYIHLITDYDDNESDYYKLDE